MGNANFIIIIIFAFHYRTCVVQHSTFHNMIIPSFIKAPSLSRLGSLKQFSFYFFFYIQVVRRQFGSTK